MCRNSLNSGTCYYRRCRYRHVDGTIRKKPDNRSANAQQCTSNNNQQNQNQQYQTTLQSDQHHQQVEDITPTRRNEVNNFEPNSVSNIKYYENKTKQIS